MSLGSLVLDPLDVTLSQNWKPWKQKFFIYVSGRYDENFPDHRKLALFLAHLGPSGLDLANRLLPELVDFSGINSDGPPSRKMKKSANYPSTEEVIEAFDKHFEERSPRGREDRQKIPNDDKCPCICGGCCCSYQSRMFGKYHAILQKYHLWHHILNYLSMADLESLSHVDGYASELIKDPELNLIIDEQITTKYPAVTSSIYQTYGKLVKSITLIDIPESDIPVICSLFPDLKSLTLRRVRIVQKDVATDYPDNLLALKLFDCTIRPDLMNSWLSKPRLSLLELHLENIHYGWYKCRINVEHFNRLEKLTIVGENEQYFPMKLPALRALRFSHSPELLPNIELYARLPKLEQLTVDQNYDFDEWGCEQSLKSLTLMDWKKDYLEDFEALEHIKIRRSVQQGNVETLNSELFPHLKTIDVHFHPASEEPNLIFRLNDDCLFHLAKYLSPTSWRDFGLAHPRLGAVLRACRPGSTKLHIKHGRKCKPPLDQYQQLYGPMGQLVTDLHMYKVQGRDFFDVLKHFPNLKRLEGTASSMEEMADPSGVSFPAIEFLTWHDHKNRPIMIDSPVLRQFNPSLHTLDLKFAEHFNLDCLFVLTNIRKLILPLLGTDCTSGFNRFIDQNKTHMEWLETGCFKDHCAENDKVVFWTTVQKMDKLEHLEMILDYINFHLLKDRSENQLRNLQELNIFVRRHNSSPELLLDFLSVVGGNLHTLEMRTDYVPRSRKLAECLPNLKRFQIDGRELEDFGDEDYSGLLSMGQLEDLEILWPIKPQDSGMITRLYEEKTMDLIKGLPNLKKIHSCPNISLGEVENLRDYLRRENRPSLMVNGKCFYSSQR